MEGCVGEESFQLWELNRRLEAYLTRVKTLEEQNQLLSAELGGLRAQSGDVSWRTRADNELAALRVLVDQRWREKHEAEVQRDNLAEELEGVAGRCQQVRLARDRTSEEVACSRRALEAEKSAQGWLSTRAAEIERELEAVRAAHEEERAHLNAQAACAPLRLATPPRGPPARAPEVEELARRLGEAWRGAVRDYQERVAHMESSLGQARERLARAMQGAREGRLELLQLQAERDSLQERREALEQRLEGRWQDRLQATEKFQLAVDALEQEKQGLQSQIAQILEGGQQLAHLKMSLSLEVATYRTLLEAENSRMQTPARSSQASRGFHDPKLKPHFLGTPEDQHLGSVLPVLSPTPLPSPMPNTLETPVTAFLKTQEFLPAQTPTLASTPIPPMPEAPCPTKAEVRAQDAPHSLLQTQGGRQQGSEPLWTKATVSVSTSEEPGGKQPSHFPKDLTSSAHPVLETKDEESSESRVSSIFQEDEGQIWELVEKEAAIEVKVESSSAQETQEDGLDMEEIQDSQGPLQKETLEAPEEEPLMSLKIQSHETSGKENCNSLRSIDQTLGTLKSSEEKQTLLKSLEEKDVESEKTLEKGLPELSLGKEDPGIEDDQELISPEGTLETVSSIGKENQVVRSSKENVEPSTAFEKESQHPLGCPEEEDQMVEKLIEKEGQESLRSLEEEDQETYRYLEKENGEPLKSVEKEDQLVERLIEKKGHESLRSLEEEDQSIVKPLERENQESLRSLDEIQETIIPPESKNQKQLKSLEQRIVNYLEKEDQEFLGSLEEEQMDSGKSFEEENQQIFRSLGKETLESLQSPEEQAPLWSPEVTRETAKPLENEIQESLGYVYGNQETLRPLERETQESRSLGKWNLETVDSLEGMGAAGQQLEAEGCLDRNEQQESARSLAEVGQELPASGNQQRWEDVVEDGAVKQDPVLGRTGVESEEVAELPLSGQSGKEEAAEDRELRLQVMGEACSLGSSEPKEQRVPSEEDSREGSTEAFQDMEGPPEQVGTLEVPVAQGMPEVTEPLLQDEAIGQTGEQDSKELSLGSEAATRAGLGLEQEGIGLGEPKHLAREEAIHPSLGEQSVEVKIAQDLEGPEKESAEAGALESEIFELPETSRDALEPKSFKESEPVVGWGVEEASVETSDHEGSAVPQPRLSETEEDEGAQAVPAFPGPKLVEPSSYIPTLEDACELQPQAEGVQEAGWQLEGGSEALGKGDEQEFGLGETPEGLQDWEESREESEADELGETLPDSTPLGLYLRSPTSPKWDLAGEKRLSPQGEARKEGWGPPVLSNPPRKEEQGPDSDLSSEEFEDLGTEASFLPGVPKGVADHLGQVPSVREPECWDQGGESDGFADEEESGEGEEEHEEEVESGARWWGPGPSDGGFKVQDITQRGDLLEQGSVGVSGPWDDGLRGAAANSSVTALDTESQDSAEPSGSEGSESVSLEGEDHLDAPQEVTSMVPGVGDTQSPNSELEHVNGRVENGLGQSEGQEVLDGDQEQGRLLQEQEVGALKAPLVVSPVHLGPSQSPEFPLSGVDGDSWSSGED
ncbi:nestin isoform X2 [Arvicola amphibius]|uniref:nestin isoform X2 n=1 Tax=Arvicola amphibius TaxID=1047088 RepID=UPI0018E37D7A|nr:nestin isoform X2 [Arvicola amphibius]